jgi:hypothetical protein
VQFKTTVTFEDIADGSQRKTRIVMRMDFPSPAERERVIKEYGADKGLAQTLTRLSEYVPGPSDRAKEDRSQGVKQEKHA